MATQIQTITADELLRMPRGRVRRELIRGELREMTPAGHNHGRIAVNAGGRLAQHVRENDLGAVYAAETGFKIESDPDTVRAPDASFVRRERADAARGVEGYFPGAPDLAIEVISPDDRYTEVEAKVFDWLDAGTRMVIVINPRKHTVSVYRSRSDIMVLTEDDTLDGADVVPGWRVPVREIFG